MGRKIPMGYSRVQLQVNILILGLEGTHALEVGRKKGALNKSGGAKW